MAQSLETSVDTSLEARQINEYYTITLDGGPEHGNFDIVPPITDQHHAALMEEPKLSRMTYSLSRDEDRNSFWLGVDFNNGSGYGVHYERAAYFARVIAHVLRLNGAEVELQYDRDFERESEQRIRRIQQDSRRGTAGF